jgi:hypothetical protein
MNFSFEFMDFHLVKVSFFFFFWIFYIYCSVKGIYPTSKLKQDRKNFGIEDKSIPVWSNLTTEFC